MKKRAWILPLALLCALALCACGAQGGEDPAPEETGIWTPVTDANWRAEDYGLNTGPEAIPAEWTLPQDADLGENPRIEVSGDLLLYGPSYESAMPEGFTVARYADGTLTQLYTFDQGMTVAWQEFFSPGGKHIVFPWKAEAGETWKIRVADLDTGVEEDLEPPAWDQDTDTLFVKWLDEANLQVSAMSAGGEEWAHWVYTFPPAP